MERILLTTTTEFGMSSEAVYPVGQDTTFRVGLPPRFRPEAVAVTEALIGSAFAVAQAYLQTKPAWPLTGRYVNDVANYWKHRDEWGPPWSTGNGSPHFHTLNAITKLGIMPPVVPGQLQALAQAALGRPFDVDALWSAIEI